ncbi:4-oxalocrotonate tautomerase family enzyme [Paraburkholderia bannensis]|uniref:4-oxalocrotonate tautomerase family enzyme n=1 Tax=Paraburkholderia bannensis TaxID=765414 RepID=A0A7W9U009_9BURK|nr:MULTISPECIES: tautomerase family protein [Paraburkholderia]MBB3258362.1 4-oxalocrotonate tautomerase family enzyme [Paraburkholderia sp. WP4_3_2]MBB6103375.1 4-oxalocrotonate tautomerase family enzyme [Paraburkholderia bannensis]
MPTLEVYVPASHAETRKAALIEQLTQATVDAIGAPVEAVRILLSELPPSDYGIGGRAASQGTPPALPVIIAILIAGRTDEQKRALIHALCKTSASVLDTPLDATRVMIKDIPNTDFGLGGKTAKSLGR